MSRTEPLVTTPTHLQRVQDVHVHAPPAKPRPLRGYILYDDNPWRGDRSDVIHSQSGPRYVSPATGGAEPRIVTVARITHHWRKIGKQAANTNCPQNLHCAAVVSNDSMALANVHASYAAEGNPILRRSMVLSFLGHGCDQLWEITSALTVPRWICQSSRGRPLATRTTLHIALAFPGQR